jgi:predicted NAD/FAD-binding protein
MAAAIWSSSPSDILDFPAATFLRFCINHGLLQVNDRPRWRTVRGGSREYVRRIAATLTMSPGQSPRQCHPQRAGRAGAQRRRRAARRTVRRRGLRHPRTADLALLQDATIEEHQVLSAVRYQANTAWLHSDLSLMPHRTRSGRPGITWVRATATAAAPCA